MCVEAIDSIVFSKGSDSSSDWQIISGSMIANNEGWARISMSLRTFWWKETCGIIENFVLSIKPISKSLQMITPQDFLLASKICQKIFHNFFNSCRKSKTDRDLFKYLKCYLNLLRLTRFAHFLIKSVRSCL